MNEYIFFDATLCQRFQQFVAELGVTSETRPDAMEGIVVMLSDELADEIEERIYAEYEALMAEQHALVETAEGDKARSLMGVNITLPDGQPCVVRIPAHHARRLFANFTVEEIHELVSSIAADAVNPSTGPLCRKA